mmetsp:Transcript_35989/g.50989  ORF Transcript_35989/g.50989 Transcript_35989/m.50989 type:complete len:97 (+) Transcript_35989:187-477(+)
MMYSTTKILMTMKTVTTENIHLKHWQMKNKKLEGTMEIAIATDPPLPTWDHPTTSTQICNKSDNYRKHVTGGQRHHISHFIDCNDHVEVRQRSSRC